MKKINILHVIAGMDRCGAETFLMNVYRNIDREKFQFYFLCYGEKKYGYEDEIIELGGKIIRTPALKKIGIRKFKKNIEEIIKKYQIDVLHAHTYFNSAIPLMVAKKINVKLRIVHSHNTKSEYKCSIIKEMDNTFSKFIIDRNANVFLACSEEAGKSLFRSRRKFIIVKNGIELKKFKFDEEKRKEIRKKLGIEDNEIVIGHVGRFETQKNHTFLIETFRNIAEKNENYRLVLIGDGSKFTNIQNDCKDLGEKVIFLGNVGNVNEYINVFDLFVFPSLFEGLGIVLIEAQTNGLKCIASTSVPKEADISENVMYLDLSDGIEKWAETIENTDIERIKFETENCEYDIDNTVKTLEQIYTEKMEGLK